MKLLSTKRVSKNNSFLIHLLCVGASYLACVSCEGMEEKKDVKLDLNEQKTFTSLNKNEDEDVIILESSSGTLESDSGSEEHFKNNTQKPPIMSTRRATDDELAMMGLLDKHIQNKGGLRKPSQLPHTDISTTDLMGGLK